MAFVYILYSKSIDKFYTGSCKNLEKRLIQHKNKEFDSSYTHRSNDWRLYLSFDDLEYQQARKMERHIKNMKSKVYIRNLRKYPEIIENLTRKYSNF